jgi:hypothetical protein
MVEQLIEEVAHSFEATWRERGELAEKVESLEKQLEDHRQRENLLTQTLLAAEQAASDVKERARHEAEAIVVEAHSEARAIVRKAQAEREQLLVESRRIEGMLRAALGNVADGMAQALPESVSSVGEERPSLGAPVTPVAQLPSSEKQLPQPTQEDMPGWPREDTDEFDEVPSDDVAQPHASPQSSQEPASGNPPQPILERMSGVGSADFDWGE